MNAPHYIELTENAAVTYLATEGKFCDRNIAVHVNIDETPIFESGIETGKAQAEYEEWNKFWNLYQNNGSRTNYEMAFAGEGWNETLFWPKYAFKNVSHAARMFAGSKIKKEDKLEIDTSECTTFDAMFSAAKGIKYIGTIDTRKSSNTQLAGLFGYMDTLHTIEKLILKDDGSQTFSDTLFNSDYQLANIEIEGVIGNSLNMRHCKSLTKASARSIINHLSDTATGKMLTLSSLVKARFTDAEWTALARQKSNWTITLV